MSFGSRPLAAVCLGLFLALGAPAAAAGPAVPASPPEYVVDLAGIIDDGVEARMNAQLRELEKLTTAQVVVLTLPSLEGESLEAFSVDLAHNRWKLGQKGKDNGVLLTLAVLERRYRIEVGYGLEAVLPDSLAGSIGRELMVPAFRAGDFGGGLAAAAGEIAARVAAASGATLSQAPPVSPRSVRSSRRAVKPSPLGILLMLPLAAVFLWLLIKHPQVLILMLLSSRGGGSRGSWGGGGGGFGGGGGGGFGGGGASGSW